MGDAIASGDWRETLVDQLKRYLRQREEVEPGSSTHPIGAVRRARVRGLNMGFELFYNNLRNYRFGSVAKGDHSVIAVAIETSAMCFLRRVSYYGYACFVVLRMF